MTCYAMQNKFFNREELSFSYLMSPLIEKEEEDINEQIAKLQNSSILKINNFILSTIDEAIFWLIENIENNIDKYLIDPIKSEYRNFSHSIEYMRALSVIAQLMINNKEITINESKFPNILYSKAALHYQSKEIQLSYKFSYHYHNVDYRDKNLENFFKLFNIFDIKLARFTYF